MLTPLGVQRVALIVALVPTVWLVGRALHHAFAGFFGVSWRMRR